MQKNRRGGAWCRLSDCSGYAGEGISGGVPLDRIHKEQALSRWAFLKGVPTAIPFDVYLEIGADNRHRELPGGIPFPQNVADKATLVRKVTDTARLLGCIRIIAYMRINADLPERDQVTEFCYRDMAMLLEQEDG